MKNQSVILRNKDKIKQGEVLEYDLKVKDNENNNSENDTMTSVCNTSSHEEGDVVETRDNMDQADPVGMVNGTSDINGNEQQSSVEKEKLSAKNFTKTSRKPERTSKKTKTPFDFMTERKLSEPVLSPR